MGRMGRDCNSHVEQTVLRHRMDHDRQARHLSFENSSARLSQVLRNVALDQPGLLKAISNAETEMSAFRVTPRRRRAMAVPFALL